MEVWEKCWNTSRRRLFPQVFRVLPNFHECFYKSIGTRRTCFHFLLENTAVRKKEKRLVNFNYQNVNSLCSRLLGRNAGSFPEQRLVIEPTEPSRSSHLTRSFILENDWRANEPSSHRIIYLTLSLNKQLDWRAVEPLNFIPYPFFKHCAPLTSRRAADLYR